MNPSATIAIIAARVGTSARLPEGFCRAQRERFLIQMME
jgi:hypothetical protein